MDWIQKLYLAFVVMTAIPVLFISTFSIDAYSDEFDLIKGHATAYCNEGITASGEHTREGICAAKKEWIGKTIILYQRLPGDKVGDVIGVYEVKDCGGTEALKAGDVIDIWEPSLDECQKFMDTVYENGCQGKIFYQLIDAVG